MSSEVTGADRRSGNQGHGNVTPKTPRARPVALPGELRLPQPNGAVPTPLESLTIAARVNELASQLSTIDAAAPRPDGSFDALPRRPRKRTGIAALDEHPMPPAALRLLVHLYRYPGVFKARAELAYVCGAKSATTSCIKVYVSRLRKALAAFGVEDAIMTGRKSYALAPSQRSGVERFLRWHIESRDIIFVSLARDPIMNGGTHDTA